VRDPAPGYRSCSATSLREGRGSGCCSYLLRVPLVAREQPAGGTLAAACVVVRLLLLHLGVHNRGERDAHDQHGARVVVREVKPL
jgi:hypothetical protein